MADRIVRITVGDITLEAELDDTPTADLVYESLPLTSSGSYWGDEFYFSIPVAADTEPGASDVVEVGAVAFWPPGNCLCLFWGPTPASHGHECRAADRVNWVGRILNIEDLRRITASAVTVEVG